MRHIEFTMNNGEKISWDDEGNTILLKSDGINGPDYYHLSKTEMNGKVFQSSELLLLKRDQVSSIKFKFDYEPITEED